MYNSQTGELFRLDRIIIKVSFAFVCNEFLYKTITRVGIRIFGKLAANCCTVRAAFKDLLKATDMTFYLPIKLGIVAKDKTSVYTIFIFSKKQETDYCSDKEFAQQRNK